MKIISKEQWRLAYAASKAVVLKNKRYLIADPASGAEGDLLLVSVEVEGEKLAQLLSDAVSALAYVEANYPNLSGCAVRQELIVLGNKFLMEENQK